MIQGLPRAVASLSEQVRSVVAGIRGVAGWVAGLDSGGKVPVSQLGTGSASSTTYLRGDRTWATVSGGPTSGTAVAGTVAVSVDFGSAFTHFAQTVVTGETWVATSSSILATPLAAKCTRPFVPAVLDGNGQLITPASAECRTSDITRRARSGWSPASRCWRACGSASA